ncbi:unnamed protein product [Malus baccata var. baccata]
MSVVEMRMLCWMYGHMRKEQIKNMDIRSKVGAATIVDKMRENWLRWFGPVNRRPTDAPFRKCNYETAHGKMVEGDLRRLGKRL